MSGFIEKLVSIFFPARCPLCGRLAGKSGLCGSCAEQLPRGASGFCYAGGDGGRGFDGCMAPFAYEGPVKAGIFRLKFKGDRSPAPFFARAAAEKVRECCGGIKFDFVSAVPLSRAVRKKRGYNQSEVFARLLARELSLPYRQALKKIREVPPQRSLPAARRRENVAGAFAAVGKVSGCRVLLADDVCTTGATLGECARVLKAAGVRSVHGVAIAAVREKTRPNSMTV